MSCCASAKSLIDREIFITGAHPTMLKVRRSRKRRLPRIASSEVKKCQNGYAIRKYGYISYECVKHNYLVSAGIRRTDYFSCRRPDNCVRERHEDRLFLVP